VNGAGPAFTVRKDARGIEFQVYADKCLPWRAVGFHPTAKRRPR
jgi:hypothetical protein